MSINVGTAVAYLDLDASKFTAGLKAAQQSLQGVSKDTNTFSAKMTSLGSGMKQTGASLSLISIPLLGLGGTITKFAMDSEEGFKKVNSILQLSEEEFNSYSKELKNGANEIKKTYNEYTEAAYQAISAGVKQNEVTGFLIESNKLAKGGLTDLTTSTDLLTTVLNSYNLSQEETSRISDVLIQTQNKGKTTVDELGSSMGKVIPTASNLNVGMEQLGASYALITSKGVATAESTTYLNSMLNEVGKSGSKVDGILREKTGKSFAELQASGMSVGDALQIVSQHAEENGKSLADMFSSSEAAKAAQLLLGAEIDTTTGEIIEGTKSSQEFNNMLGEMQNSTGLANKAFETMNSTTKEKLNQSLATLKNALTDIGEKLVPLVGVIADVVAKFADWLNWLNQTNPAIMNIVLAIGGFIAILGPLLLIIGQLIISVTAIVGVFTSGGVAATAFGAVMGALSGPIGIVIGVIAALITIGVLLYKNWEEICAFGTQVWNAFTQWFSATMESVTNFFKQVWESCCQAVSNIWESIKTTAANVFNGIKDTITNITNGTKAVIQSIWEVIKNYFSSVLNNIKNIVSTLFNNVRNIINSIMQGISNQIQNIWNAIKTIFSNVLGLIKGIVSTDFALIKSSITNILNAVKDFCSSTWSNILSTCSSILGGIVNTVANIFNGIKNSISSALQACYNTALGWWNNIKSIFSAPINAVVNIFKKESTQTQSLDDGIAVASDMPTNENLSRAKFDFESTRNALDTSYIAQSLMQSGLNALETKLNVKQSNQPVNNNNTINLNLNIDKVENSNERNIEDLAEELAFYLKRKRVAF